MSDIKYKYNHGDKVVIKGDLKIGYIDSNHLEYVCDDMVDRFSGVTVTIMSKLRDMGFEAYTIKEDVGEYYWTPNMFEELLCDINIDELAKLLEV